jgi:hypothetical protein
VFSDHRFLRIIRLVAIGISVSSVTESLHAEPGGTARTEADRTNARELMRAGNELYGEGKLSEAYAKYLEAWRMAQAFDIACNLGGTASELSMNRDAAEYLDYCLRHYPASSRPESVAAEQRARAAFEVVRTKVAALNVRVTPAGAEVFVDGTIAGRAPLEAPVFLEAGPHRIEARHPGLESIAIDVNAKRGEATETAIELKPVAGAAAANADAGAKSSQNPGADASPADSKNYFPAILTASVGGVALAGGVVFLVMRSGKRSDAEDELSTLDGTNPCGPHSPAENVPTCNEVEDLSKQAATFGNLSIVSFGVAAGAGIATYFLWPKGGSAAGRGRVLPDVAVSRDGVYASLRGAF